MSKRKKMLIHWQDIVEKSEAGTPLVAYTLRQVNHELDEYIQQHRTGVKMALKKGLPWKAILAELNMDPDNVDHKKVLSFLEKDLDSTLETWASRQGPSKVVDPAFAKSAKTRLHTIMGKRNEMPLIAVATLYASEHEDNVDSDTISDIASQIRMYTKTDNSFSVGIGGAATIRQLKSKDGKPTGTQAHPPRGEGGSGAGHKAVQRFTNKVQALGISKAQFEQAKAKFHGMPTMDDLKEFASSQN